ncbi:SLC45 family MFS transporter [Cohnella lubricantis]|uniref:SLC45 family MFS transporter n=1 Tax=Cohnella lubricantis TaxID=2163172 RepID=A0A841TII6_9BACL|nr:SLC45 family MFS transporter [Cohnella lubricantis]MBB6679058.1 SLC45 family MFS transporter [Cohnella lubricantis]MBP2117145.1 MFS family permease [Cohnella lubricantis]
MRKTWLLGFGFFSISITWALYNAFVPFFLDSYLTSTALIGFMMTIDNYFALFLQPWIGSRSDRTESRFGKRMPYLLIGMPLAALFVILVPFHTSFLTLVLFMVLMNLSMSIYRSPTIALMPDITPEAKRTKANGIINFMGGVGGILAYGVGSALYGAHKSFPFIAAAAITLLAMWILYRTIREKRDGVVAPAPASERIRWRGELDRTTVLLLLAIFFWFVSYQGVEALFTLYGKHHLGLSEDAAAFSLTFYSLFFVLFAIPSGWLGNRFGKKRIILIGVCGLFAVFALVPLIKGLLLLRVLLAFGGIFWACININSYPFVVSTGAERSIGTRTGLYYLASSLAAISSPPLLGLVIDKFGYASLFVCASGGMLVALLFLLLVKHKGQSADSRPSAASVGN